MFKGAFDSLGPCFAARAEAIVAAREATGCNVHFTNAQGQRDRRSFATPERATAFRQRMGA